jgi:hypothetical protein
VPGQSDGTTFLADGGEIDDGDADDQSPDDNAPTPDPMSVIQNALGWGRQQMGLPQDFFSQDQQPDEQQPGYDDGGVIPEQPQQDDQQGDGAQLPDPRRTMAYLAGAGNMPPDAAMALEQRADPQGQMAPSERKMAAVASAGSPQAQFGLLQHYRTRFNAYSAGAQAAMDQGNMAQAAQAATKAMENVPNGHNVRFAPAKGGLVMHSAPHAQQGGQQQGMAEGGAVDADNPAVIMKGYKDGGKVQAFDGSGEVLPEGDVLPEGEDNDNQDDADNTDDVIPNTVPGNPVTDVTQQRAEPDGATPTPTGSVDLSSQVTPISASGLKQLFQNGGWDKLVEGWNDQAKQLSQEGGLPGMVLGAGSMLNKAAGALNSGINSAVNWISGNDAPDTKAAIAADQPDQTAIANQSPGGQQGVIPNQPQGPNHVGTAEEFGRYIPQAIKTQQDFNRQRYGTDNFGNKLPPQQDQGRTTTWESSKLNEDDPLAKFYQNIKQQAAVQYPNEAQRQQDYIRFNMKEGMAAQHKIDATNAAYTGKQNISNNVIAGQNQRAAARVAEQWAYHQGTIQNRAATAEQNNFLRARGQNLTANPSLLNDPEKLDQYLAPFKPQMKQLGITPQDIVQNARAVGQAAQQGAQPQQGEQQPQQNSQAPETAVANGKTYYKVNGKWFDNPKGQ